MKAHPDHVTRGEFANLRGMTRSSVTSLLRSNQLPYILTDGGWRLIHRDAALPVVEYARTGEDGGTERRCSSCKRWLGDGAYGASRLTVTAPTCKQCLSDKERMRQRCKNDPLLHEAYRVTVLRDREIVAQRRNGRAPAPSEDRIRALQDCVAAAGMAGDGADWSDA